MAEEARLESVYTSKAYPEFESRSLRPTDAPRLGRLVFFVNDVPDFYYLCTHKLTTDTWQRTTL